MFDLLVRASGGYFGVDSDRWTFFMGGWGWVYIFLLVGGCGWGWLEVYFGWVWVGNIFYRWLEWVGNGGGIFWVGGGGGLTFLWVCRGGWGE